MSKDMLDELVHGLLEIIQQQAVKIVLYGSVARGTDTPESDVDIALLMNGRPDAEQEDRMSELISDLNLKYDKVFSVVDIDHGTYLKWENTLPFYRNVSEEGIVLWKAA